MSKRQLLFLWILVAALGTAVFVIKRNQMQGHAETTSRTRGQTILENFPAEEVASITIVSGKEKTTLHKKNGIWCVAERSDYPAENARINELLRTLNDLKVAQGIETNASYYTRFGVATDSAVAAEHGVEIHFHNDANTEIAGLVLGKTIETAQSGNSIAGAIGGRYIRNLMDNSGVYVASETFPSTTAAPKTWLAERFLNVEKPVSITVSEPAKPDSIAWKMTRKDDQSPFALEGATAQEKIDPSIMSSMQNLLSYARFADVASEMKPGDLTTKKDVRTARVQTLEGFIYTLTFATKEDAKAGTSEPTLLLSFQVDAQFPEKRQKPTDEKPEDTQKHDEAFATRLEQLKAKLAKEKELSAHVYEMTDWSLLNLTKARADLLLKPRPASQPTQATTPPMLMPR